MTRVTAERSKGLRVVVNEHLSRPALLELRQTVLGTLPRVSLQRSFADRSIPTLLIEVSVTSLILRRMPELHPRGESVSGSLKNERGL